MNYNESKGCRFSECKSIDKSRQRHVVIARGEKTTKTKAVSNQEPLVGRKNPADSWWNIEVVARKLMHPLKSFFCRKHCSSRYVWNRVATVKKTHFLCPIL
jgi:hypothetical protein